MKDQASQNTNQNNGLMDSIMTVHGDLQDDMADMIPALAGDLSENFARLDPDLMALYKDMKDAHGLLSHARQTGGMTDMAKWRYESAESAYKTRMMEVRSAKFKMASDQEKREALAKRELHETTMQSRMNEQFAALRRRQMAEKKRQEQSSGSWFFYFILGLWLAQMQAQQLRLREERHHHAQNAFKKVHAA